MTMIGDDPLRMSACYRHPAAKPVDDLLKLLSIFWHPDGRRSLSTGQASPPSDRLMRQDAHNLLDPGLPFLMGTSFARCSAFDDRQEFGIEPRDDSRYFLERRLLCRPLYD